MSKEISFMPELRFPEFTIENIWEADSVQNIVTTKIPPKKLQSSEYLEIGVFPIIDQSQSFYCGYTNDQQAIINKDLPLVIFGDHTCNLKMAREPFAQGADGIKILKSKAFIDPEYLYQYLTYNGVKQENYKRHYSKLKEKIVPYPGFESGEQQKIASCLSSLDELIAAHNAKLDALKDHKKGLLQNLFPNRLNHDSHDEVMALMDGEKNHTNQGNQKNHSSDNVPRVRFPEFEGDGEWVEKSIGSIAKVSAGGTPTSTEQKYWGGNIPWMSSGELNLKRVYSVEKTITELGLKESSTKKIPPLCVLIGLAGQGKTRGTAAINHIELCTNQSIAAIHPSRKKFDSEFLYHKIDSMYKTLRRLSTGQGGRGGLNLSIIREIKISFPSLEEQQKIASCLSAVDELITAQQEKIEQLQQHKKGLMQGLFPKIV